VVIAVGVSSGVRWEFQQFEDPENRVKLSLMILPEEGSVVATWRMFTAQYRDLLQSGENHIEKSLAVRFDRSGLPLFICSKKKSAQGYRIALNACLLPLDKFLQVTQSRGLDYRTAGV
jgi:hypothetical protein